MYVFKVSSTVRMSVRELIRSEFCLQYFLLGNYVLGIDVDRSRLG